MDWTRQDLALAEAREAAYAMPLDDIDVTHWDLFRNDTLYPFFERLRREKPVHFHEHANLVRFGLSPATTGSKRSTSTTVAFRPNRQSAWSLSFARKTCPCLLPWMSRNTLVNAKSCNPWLRRLTWPLSNRSSAADPTDARRVARRRALQLGRARVYRTHDPDAGDSIRLPL